MEIAGAVIGVQSLFQSTKEYCRPYLTDKESEHFILVTAEDLAAEQLILEKEAVEQGIKPRKFKEPFLERATIQRRVADFLIGCNALMLHGSTIAVDGKAYLFTAPCGTGKSTHTRLWRRLFGDRAMMVNDDKPFLRIIDRSVYACGSPWCGKHGLASNVSVPLQGICVLSRGKENLIQRADSASVMEILRQQAHSPLDADLLAQSFDLIDIITRYVPLWQLRCNMEQEAARVSYEAMSCMLQHI
jgi:hypothetical protein